MPTVNFTIADFGVSSDRAILLYPRYLSFSDEAETRDWSVLGLKAKVLGTLIDSAPSSDVGTLNLLVTLPLADIARSEDRLILVTEAAPVVELAFSDIATTADGGTLRYIAAFALTDSAVSMELVDFVPAMPIIRDPLPGELRGTVNLVRNPSLEYDDVALADWTAAAGITLTRTSAAEAWVGAYSGRAAVAAASGSPAVTIASQDGLTLTGYGRWWVGAAELRGDPASVSLVLRLTYSDATTQDSTPVVIDSTVDVPLSDTIWQRYATEPLLSNPAKTLMRLDLVLAATADAVLERILRIDGVQIEEAVTGGATSYTDGDQGDGFWWTGRSGLSMSVRDTA